MKSFAVICQYFVPQHLLSRIVGLLINCPFAPWKNFIINWFIERYGVEMRDAKEPDPKAYKNFNQFFTRELKDNLRHIISGQDTIACPVDGTVSEFGKIHNNRLIQAKGMDYSLESLLGGDPNKAIPFQAGEFATIYLSPKDYHRVHMPITGILREMTYVPGRLFSVNPLTTSQVPSLFARNERVIALFDTAVGPVAVILVGAMIVASIHTTWAGQVTPPRRNRIITDTYTTGEKGYSIAKGEYMGHFQLGSTAILLFPENTIQWSKQIAEGKSVQMGQLLAHVTSAQE